MLLAKRSLGTLSMLGLILSGCETTNPHENLNLKAPVSSLKSNKTMQPHIAHAFALLKEEKYSEASTYINEKLQSQPKSVILHILNALTYEKLAEKGEATGLELAVIGYQNAINLDPFNSFPIIQLGKIRYRDQQFDQAQEHFANALLLKPNDPDLIHEFAAASYYAYDIKTAIAAIKKAENLKPEDPLIQRSAAMMHAAVGDFKTAEKHFKAFQATVGQDPEVTHVAARFSDWQSLYKSGRLTLAAAQSTPPTTSQTPTPTPTTTTTQNQTPVPQSSGGSTSNDDSESETSDSDDSDDSDEGLTVDTPFPSESEIPTKQEFKRSNEGADIVDVPVTPGISASGGGPGGGLGGGDGPPPQMPHASKGGAPVPKEKEEAHQIIMDCYVLQITENTATSKGNNILQNLAVTLNPGSYSVFKGSMWGSGALPKPSSSTSDNIQSRSDAGFNTASVTTNGSPTTTYSPGTVATNLLNAGSISGQIFTSGITWAGLTYSLNIANAVDQRTEIVSRPTLMTFLKKESRFFSGIELVNVAPGNYGSNLSRYQIGVSIAVTPDSLIGDLVSLSIGVEASIQTTPNPNLLQTVVVDKTRVETTVRVLLGETIMLGGIYERDEVSQNAGFPGLRNLPIIQYFFANETTASSRRSIAILLTPRSPDTYKSAVNRAMARESVKPHISELVCRNPDWFNPEINGITIFNYINLDPVLYYEFRTGDILPPSWGFEPPLHDKLAELSSFLYF